MMDNENEPSRDPRMTWVRHPQEELEGHHAMSVYVGFHVPATCRRKGHRKHHHHHHTQQKSKDFEVDINRPEDTPPAERVRFLLDKEGENERNEPHPVFSEMEEFHQYGNEMEWRETARWVKFEEDVEEGGNRWSKPHIATVSLHSLLVLRSCLLNGVVLLDVEAVDLEEISDILLTNITSTVPLTNEQQQKLKDILLSRHRHQHERHNDWMDKGSRLPLIKSHAEVGKSTNGASPPEKQSGSASEDIPHNFSVISLTDHHNSQPQSQNSDKDSSSADFFHWFGKTFNSLPALERHQLRQGFMKKIPPDAQASNILVGELDFLEKTVTAFVRLHQASTLGDLTEVPIPTKFLFIILGPQNSFGTYHEVGRAFAAVMSDEVFHDVAYKAETRQDLLAGIDEFMDAATVLPASAWDPNMRIEPPEQGMAQENRRKHEGKEGITDSDHGSEDGLQEIGLKRTGRLFGGLVNDVIHKAAWYKSDIKDFFALQCIASVVFLYFACLVPIITFGGLLGHITKQRMAAMENLLASVVCGTIYSLLSGQPLTILGTTGALLVFEGTIFNYCEWWNIEYLPFRLWIGLWITVILFLLVEFDACVLVCYITRFTEEIFATLISVIFIVKAFENVINIKLEFPMKSMSSGSAILLCQCRNSSHMNDTSNHESSFWKSEEDCINYNGTFVSDVCTYSEPYYVPNVFLMSLILFAGTFALTIIIRKLKTSRFFNAKIRHGISDFAVIIAMVSATLLDWSLGFQTPKLDVPQDFKPTWSERGWVVPFFGKNQWWTALVAAIPAVVATVVIFMDQQITAVIINRKENKLKKGCGYHLDLFVLAILITICSIFGLPWVVAATMLSMTHVASLKMVSHCLAPGEKPRVTGVREQRGTHLCISVLIALSMFFTPLLKHIPMPVLYGIFLYMGFVSLKNLQFLDRVLMLFMPQKYQPDYIFLRHVPIRVVHCYTAIQITCLVVLFAIKFFPESALFFPAVLVVVILIRRHLLIYVFNEVHLKILDNNDDSKLECSKKFEDNHRDDSQNFSAAYHCCHESEELSSGSLVKKKADRCMSNISELLTQSSVWKCIDQQSQKTPPFQRKQSQFSFKKKKKQSSSKHELCSPSETQCLQPMIEIISSPDDNPSSDAQATQSESTKINIEQSHL